MKYKDRPAVACPGESRALLDDLLFCFYGVGLRHPIFANFSLACCRLCLRQVQAVQTKIYGQFVKFDAAFSYSRLSSIAFTPGHSRSKVCKPVCAWNATS